MFLVVWILVPLVVNRRSPIAMISPPKKNNVCNFLNNYAIYFRLEEIVLQTLSYEIVQ